MAENTPRPSPYYWQYNGAQIQEEFRPPAVTGTAAPSLGIGSQRANPTTGVPEYWDGTQWVIIGTGTSGIIVDTVSITADGSSFQFNWNHGLGFDPTSSGFTIDPITPAAQGIYSKSADATKFYVNYDLCPQGTLTFNTTAKTP